MTGFKVYLKRIWDARYFWLHLVRADLKYKFRRSKLGIMWTFIYPLMLTLLMSFVFGTIFNQPPGEYAPYVLSGLVTWELIVNSVIYAGASFIVSEGYIRQFNHPVVIYSLKSMLVSMATFLIAIMSLFIWMMFLNPYNIIITIITLPFTIITFFIVLFPISIISSFINTKYRDFSQVMNLLMQALWYVSPVFFKSEMLESSEVLSSFMNLNPVTHILNLIREPILYGNIPSIYSYIYILLLGVVIAFFAIRKIRKHEKEVIFYL